MSFYNYSFVVITSCCVGLCVVVWVWLFWLVVFVVLFRWIVGLFGLVHVVLVVFVVCCLFVH